MMRPRLGRPSEKVEYGRTMLDAVDDNSRRDESTHVVDDGDEGAQRVPGRRCFLRGSPIRNNRTVCTF